MCNTKYNDKFGTLSNFKQKQIRKLRFFLKNEMIKGGEKEAE